METALLWIGIALAGVLGVIGVYWIYLRLMLTEAPRASRIFQVPTADGWTIRVCRYTNPENPGPPVILCHGIMANQFSLTAPEGDSLVDVLVERGFDCWVMDARGTRSSTAPPGKSRYDARASDYALQDMPALIDFVRSTTGYEKVHWAGHSMGGLMLYMYLAAYGSDSIASGTTIGSPPGFNHFKPERIGWLVFLVGLAPVVMEFLWRCNSVLFKVFRVNSRMVPINWDNMDPRVGAATFFNMVELLPHPAVMELQACVETRQWKIRNGEIDVNANLSKMDAPLLLVFGNADLFTPLEPSRALYDSLPKGRKRLLILGRDHNCLHDYSHVDLVFSPRGRTEVYEPIAAWMEAHRIKKGTPKLHPMPHAHAPEPSHTEKPAAAAGSLELERAAKPTHPPAKVAPRAHRPSKRKRNKTARRKRSAKPTADSGAKPKGKSSEKPVYATQKKVARKRKAAKKAGNSKAGPKPTKKKTASKKASAAKPRTTKKKPAANRKSAPKKKPAARKSNNKSTVVRPKKKPAKRKR